MYDLAKNFKKNTYSFDWKNAQKGFFGTKKNQESCQENQEISRILARNPGKPKNKREKVRD